MIKKPLKKTADNYLFCLRPDHNLKEEDIKTIFSQKNINFYIDKYFDFIFSGSIDDYLFFKNKKARIFPIKPAHAIRFNTIFNIDSERDGLLNKKMTSLPNNNGAGFSFITHTRDWEYLLDAEKSSEFIKNVRLMIKKIYPLRMPKKMTIFKNKTFMCYDPPELKNFAKLVKSANKLK